MTQAWTRCDAFSFSCHFECPVGCVSARSAVDTYVSMSSDEYMCIFGTMPITASSAGANWSLCDIVPREAEAWQVSEFSGEARDALIVAEVMIMNHFCILHAKSFTPLRPETGLKQYQNVMIRPRHLVNFEGHIRNVVVEVGHVHRHRRRIHHRILELGLDIGRNQKMSPMSRLEDFMEADNWNTQRRTVKTIVRVAQENWRK